MTIRQRRLREDALQNRGEILRVARSAIQELGINVAFEEIAKKSGVGRATIYRNFPDRQSLLVAIYELNLMEIEKEADRIGKCKKSFFILLKFIYEMGINNRSLSYLIRSADFPAKDRERLNERFIRIFEEPVAHSKAAGVLRSDFQPKNVLLITNMLGGATDGIDPADKRSLNLAFSLMTQTLEGQLVSFKVNQK